MNPNVASAAWIAGAFFAGAVPFGYLIGRLRGVDVRTVGSKNIGATNVFRTVGRKWGLVAFACDVLKGLLPVLAARHWGSAEWLPLAAGVASVLGHMFTPFMKFKGGKGVATAFGMLIALAPALVGAAFLLFAAVFALSHYISLGSCSAALFLAVAVWLPAPWPGHRPTAGEAALITLVAIFVVWKHRSNISRLLAGTENKIYLSGRKDK